MTYCCGILVRDGLVVMCDTRTNAGIDNISIYRKLHIVADGPDRLIAIASAGNLSVTQAVLAMLAEGLPADDPDEPRRTLLNEPTMFRAAQLVGEAVVLARRAVAARLDDTKVPASIGLLVAGRIGDGALALFQLYNEGNFIACQPDAPFLQIGEYKYGKPILDRALSWTSPLDEAVKVAMISFDSTIRSNLSVGRPLDLIAIPTDRTLPVVRRRIEVDDPYFNALSEEWGRLLNESRRSIRDPDFMAASVARVDAPAPPSPPPAEAELATGGKEPPRASPA